MHITVLRITSMHLILVYLDTSTLYRHFNDLLACWVTIIWDAKASFYYYDSSPSIDFNEFFLPSVNQVYQSLCVCGYTRERSFVHKKVQVITRCDQRRVIIFHCFIARACKPRVFRSRHPREILYRRANDIPDTTALMDIPIHMIASRYRVANDTIFNLCQRYKICMLCVSLSPYDIINIYLIFLYGKISAKYVKDLKTRERERL